MKNISANNRVDADGSWRKVAAEGISAPTDVGGYVSRLQSLRLPRELGVLRIPVLGKSAPTHVGGYASRLHSRRLPKEFGVLCIPALRIIVIAAVLGLAIGCATTKQTEVLLSAAAFKTVPASTPQRQAQLKQLPKDKLTKVVRGGKTYFVYPDKARGVLYVGDEAQFQQYQMLCQQQKQLAKDGAELRGAEPSNEAYWNGWGDAEHAWGWE